MSTFTNRTPKGVRAGGQFAADVHTEPTATLATEAAEPSDPQVLRNLNRAISPVPELTDNQKDRLRSHKTPLLNTFKRKGFTLFAPAAKVAPREEPAA